MSGETRRCYACKEVKPMEDFPIANEKKGRGHQCKTCRAADQAARRAELTPEEKAAASRAFRAGMRVNRCAVCGTGIKAREGICETCEECVEVLGGLDGLKRAVRAVRYLQGK